MNNKNNIQQSRSLDLLDKLEAESILSMEEFIYLLENFNDDIRNYAAQKAVRISEKYFGKKIYIRGLIEFTNFCKNDCLYCGIRKSNINAQRYRLSKEDIMSCCQSGYELGFRTFVLQGGEDYSYSDDDIADIVKTIKNKYTDCAITLSIGEKTRESYQKFFDAGADRYLLRHETATEDHYKKIHPKDMSLKNRKNCLVNLKSIGYQTGCGIMVGSPYQTVENISRDLIYMHNLKPEMIGIGPFIPHKDTPFADFAQGSLEMTLFLLSIIRIMQKNVLLPATTALGTISPKGRELGILAGANVLMPNLSPVNVREKYSLYDNKICTKEEAAECIDCLKKRISSIGYELVTDRGDYREVF